MERTNKGGVSRSPSPKGRRESSDSDGGNSDSEASRQTNSSASSSQRPRWKERRQDGGRTRSEWRGKSLSDQVKDLSDKVSAFEDASKESKAQAQEEEDLRHERELNEQNIKAFDAFEGRTFVFAEEIRQNCTTSLSTILCGGLANIVCRKSRFNTVSLWKLIWGMGRVMRTRHIGDVLRHLSTLCGAMVVNAVGFWTLWKILSWLIPQVIGLQKKHRYTISQMSLEHNVASDRPIGQSLTKCDYTCPLMAHVTYEPMVRVRLFPQVEAWKNKRLHYTIWRQPEVDLNVSVEVLMQLILPKTTAVDASVETLGGSLTSTLKALHAVAVAREDNADRNVLEETKLAAYGLIRSHRERVDRVPFPRSLD